MKRWLSLLIYILSEVVIIDIRSYWIRVRQWVELGTLPRRPIMGLQTFIFFVFIPKIRLRNISKNTSLAYIKLTYSIHGWKNVSPAMHSLTKKTHFNAMITTICHEYQQCHDKMYLLSRNIHNREEIFTTINYMSWHKEDLTLFLGKKRFSSSFKNLIYIYISYELQPN